MRISSAPRTLSKFWRLRDSDLLSHGLAERPGSGGDAHPLSNRLLPIRNHPHVVVHRLPFDDQGWR